jgi:hypothetical protein
VPRRGASAAAAAAVPARRSQRSSSAVVGGGGNNSSRAGGNIKSGSASKRWLTLTEEEGDAAAADKAAACVNLQDGQLQQQDQEQQLHAGTEALLAAAGAGGAGAGAQAVRRGLHCTSSSSGSCWAAGGVAGIDPCDEVHCKGSTQATGAPASKQRRRFVAAEGRDQQGPGGSAVSEIPSGPTPGAEVALGSHLGGSSSSSTALSKKVPAAVDGAPPVHISGGSLDSKCTGRCSSGSEGCTASPVPAAGCERHSPQQLEGLVHDLCVLAGGAAPPKPPDLPATMSCPEAGVGRSSRGEGSGACVVQGGGAFSRGSSGATAAPGGTGCSPGIMSQKGPRGSSCSGSDSHIVFSKGGGGGSSSSRGASSSGANTQRQQLQQHQPVPDVPHMEAPVPVPQLLAGAGVEGRIGSSSAGTPGLTHPAADAKAASSGHTPPDAATGSRGVMPAPAADPGGVSSDQAIWSQAGCSSRGTGPPAAAAETSRGGFPMGSAPAEGPSVKAARAGIVVAGKQHDHSDGVGGAAILAAAVGVAPGALPPPSAAVQASDNGQLCAEVAAAGRQPAGACAPAHEQPNLAAAPPTPAEQLLQSLTPPGGWLQREGELVLASTGEHSASHWVGGLMG